MKKLLIVVCVLALLFFLTVLGDFIWGDFAEGVEEAKYILGESVAEGTIVQLHSGTIMYRAGMWQVLSKHGYAAMIPKRNTLEIHYQIYLSDLGKIVGFIRFPEGNHQENA